MALYWSVLSIPPQTQDITEPLWLSSRFCCCSLQLFSCALIYLFPVYILSLEISLRGRVLGKQKPGCYSRRFSYMLLDWAQILKGSGFFCPELSACSGAGASAVGYSGSTCVLWLGDAVCRLRWLETLCCELFWLSFLSNGCWKQARGGKKRLLLVLWVGVFHQLVFVQHFCAHSHKYINNILASTFLLLILNTDKSPGDWQTERGAGQIERHNHKPGCSLGCSGRQIQFP